jgi:hypothetical protein
MLRAVLRLLLLALAFALATYVAGWWALLLLGSVWGALNPGFWRIGIRTGLAAAAGWALLLVWTATQGPLAEVASKAGGVMGVAPVALYAATLLFAGLVAGSSAGLVASFLRPPPQR